jgi:hypothetical protein
MQSSNFYGSAYEFAGLRIDRFPACFTEQKL